MTEAAQRRLTFIHGSREALKSDSYEFDDSHRRFRALFEGRCGNFAWNEVVNHSSGDLEQDLGNIRAGLICAGYNRIYRTDLTSLKFGISVVKIFVPGLRTNSC